MKRTPTAIGRTLSCLSTFCAALLGAVCLMSVSSCSDDCNATPPFTTEMADVQTDAGGRLAALLLDDDTRYVIENQKAGYKPNTAYRALADFCIQGGKAHVYSLMNALVLKDSTATPMHDPVKVQSVWRTQKYINIHLSPRTQGGRQYWGYIVDSVTESALPDGTPCRHICLSLHHNQNGDPESYTTEVYASIAIHSITDIGPNDRITLRINKAEYEL